MKNKIILIIIVFMLGIEFVDAKSNIDLSVLHDLDDVEIVDYEEKTFCTTTMEDINGNVFIVNEFEIAENDLNNIDEIIAFEESKYPKTNQNSRASSVGEVYASYQHAINASTTLALSKDYVFASNGLGQVIKFNNNTTAGYYDGMNGIYVDGYIGPLDDYYDYS